MGQNRSIPVAVVLDWGIVTSVAVWGPENPYSHRSRKLLSMMTCFTPVWPSSLCIFLRFSTTEWEWWNSLRACHTREFHPNCLYSLLLQTAIEVRSITITFTVHESKAWCIVCSENAQSASEHIAFHCSSTPLDKSNTVFPEVDSLMQH